MGGQYRRPLGVGIEAAGWTHSKNERQALHIAATKERVKDQEDDQSRRWQDDTAKKDGTTWNRTALDRQHWKALMEGYILQWMDNAKVK